MQTRYSVFDERDQLAGYAILSLASEFGDWTLHTVRTLVHARGRGHGNRLMELIKADADREGAILHVYCASSDPEFPSGRLRRWYVRHGFVFEDDEMTGVRCAVQAT